MTRRTRLGLLFGLAAWLAAAGPGCDAPREFAEVEGVVTVDGKPIPGVEVMFLPDPEKGNPGNTSSGVTDRDGRYRLRSDRDERDGTVLGFHRVLLIDGASRKDPSGLNDPPSRLPAAYEDAAQTPLKDVEVKPGPQKLDFNVARKAP